MSRRLLLPVALMLAASATAAVIPGSRRGAEATPLAPSTAAASVAAPASLPDTFAIARVDGKPIRVSDFIRSYFNSYAEFRPKPDSAGRVEFLNSMIDKEVMAAVARQVAKPMSFEDRIRLRDDTQKALGNTLFQRSVLDSAAVTEEETQKRYETYKYDQHFRQIIFDDKETAERVKADILAKRITWDDAVRRYHHAERDTARGSDLGWVQRSVVDPAVAPHLYGLAPGEISPVIYDRSGYRIVQSVERRPARVAAFRALHTSLRAQLLTERRSQFARRLQKQVGASVGMQYDSTNIAWAAARFGHPRTVQHVGGQMTLDISTTIPEFSDADTARVLARYRDGVFTVGSFVRSFSEIPPLTRPDVGDPDTFEAEVDAIVLEPYMAQLALQRGLDRDSMTIATIAQRQEQRSVEHLYADSIASRATASPQARRRYYEQHIAQYHTYAKVSFAAIVRDTRTSADSVEAALRSGVRAVDILRADSLKGQVTGSIKEQNENDQGAPYHKLLFQELRPGQAAVVGPGQDGTWAVIQVLDYDPGRQLSFVEADPMVSESVTNLDAERLLKAFLVRHRRRHHIEAHPELVMRFQLSDPTFVE